MKLKTKKYLSYGLDALFIILVIIAFVKYKNLKDPGQYSHCVQWDGYIYREDLVWQCYNFKEQKILCDWETENNILTIYEYGNRSNVYSQSVCTLYVKTLEIYPEGIPSFEELNLP